MKISNSIMGLAVAWLGLCGGVAQAQVGEPVDVAPQAPGTRSQGWATAAWSEGAQQWLVVWREGCLNDDATDIWAARIAADGKSLDPAGIRLTQGPGLKDHPQVASDGKGWFVVWQELNTVPSVGAKQGWDIRGRRVGADGKPAGETILIAGGERNQCLPAVAFASGLYHVAWSGMMGNGNPGDKGTGYGLFAVRVSPDGKLLDAQPRQLVSHEQTNALYACMAHGGDSVVVTFVDMPYRGSNMWNRVVLDARTGEVRKAARPPVVDARKPPLSDFNVGEAGLGSKHTGRFVPIVWGRSCYLTAKRTYANPPNQITLFSVSAEGEPTKGDTVGTGCEGGAHFAVPRWSLGFDGERFLLVAESRQLLGGKPGGRNAPTRLEIWGWYVDESGKVLTDKAGIVIAPASKYEQMLPFVCGGPKGVCLVVNSELRGVDDLKLVARLVRHLTKP